MEQFGARTEGPLETCLAEVEQSDVYVGIIAYRFGSIDPHTGKSFTQAEYEHAVSLGKDVLIYIADDTRPIMPAIHIDADGRSRQRLKAFKAKLREKHTVDTFSTPDDLAEKLQRDFQRHFVGKPSSPGPEDETEAEYEKAVHSLRQFRLTPKPLSGREIRVTIAFSGEIYAASRTLCESFNLDYGSTIGCKMRITNPENRQITRGFRELYATGGRVRTLQRLRQQETAEVYALMQFSPSDVKVTHAEFFDNTYYEDPRMEESADPYEVFVPAQGKVILLLSKSAARL